MPFIPEGLVDQVHPDRWSLKDRFSYEFRSSAEHFRKFSKVYLICALAFVVAVSIATWVRQGATLGDVPLLLLASTIHLLQAVAIVSLLFAWLGGRLIQEWLYARMSRSWTASQSMRTPAVSFSIPHWRFYLPAASARWLLFASYVWADFFLLYVVPGKFQKLTRFIPDNFPF